MRIEDLIEQGYVKIRKSPKLEVVPFTLTDPKNPADLSLKTKAGEQEPQTGGGYFTASPEANEARLAFKSYMDKITGREPSMPKTPEEKMEELAERIKKLQGRLSEVIADESLSDEAKSNQVTTLTAQINEAYAQLTEISKELGGSASGESAEG